MLKEVCSQTNTVQISDTAPMRVDVRPTGVVRSREMWQLLEAIHFAVYLAPEVAERYRTIGLKGFWMGYFASRSYPLGPVPPEVVTATFFWFSPVMVRRALPDAWRYAAIEDVAQARLEGVDAALRRILGEHIHAPQVAEAADLAAEALTGCRLDGRPLFAAYASLPWPRSDHMRLWHAATLLREHRGDGHIAANLAHGLDGLASHVAHIASGTISRDLGQPARGWTDDEWADCEAQLAARGWLADGRLTAAGHQARASVEQVTDELAAEPWTHLGANHAERLASLTRPIAQTLVEAGVMPVPNPIGAQWPPPSAAGVSRDQK